jgi:hypothetical protein
MALSTETALKKNYAPAVLQRLKTFPDLEQKGLTAWLLKNPVGTNYALQILECLRDLAKKEERKSSVLLTETVAQMEPETLHPKKLGRKVRDQLAERLHPISREHEERFVRWVKSLGLPANVKLIPPQNFEGNRFDLQISFENTEELQIALKETKASLKKRSWKQLPEF